MSETKICPYCGEEIMAAAKKCKFCGEWLETPEQDEQPKPTPQQTVQNVSTPSVPVEQAQTIPLQTGQTIIINQQPVRPVRPEVKRNGMGITGFVLAMVGLFFSWVPVFGWTVWALGLIFSFIGVFKTPRGLAIAGLVVSVVGLIMLILIATVISAAVDELFW